MTSDTFEINQHLTHLYNNGKHTTDDDKCLEHVCPNDSLHATLQAEPTSLQLDKTINTLCMPVRM